jgi:hypothetical protein
LSQQVPASFRQRTTSRALASFLTTIRVRVSFPCRQVVALLRLISASLPLPSEDDVPAARPILPAGRIGMPRREEQSLKSQAFPLSRGFTSVSRCRVGVRGQLPSVDQ